MENLKQARDFADRFKYQAEKYDGYSWAYKGIKVDQVRGKLKQISENVQMLQVQMTAFYLQPINQSSVDNISQQNLADAIMQSMTSFKQQQ